MSTLLKQATQPRHQLSTIYGLVDPNTGVIRYVGKADDAPRRYNDHLRAPEINGHTRKARWLKKLLSGGYKPVLIVIEIVHKDMWQYTERKWIAFYRAQPDGYMLTNFTPGGEGAEKGFKHKPETLQKISASHSTPEFRQKHSEWSRKRPKRPNCTSKFSGVSWASKDQRWRVCITYKGKMIEVGYFTREVEAAHARDRFIIEYFPNLGIDLNFPDFDYSTPCPVKKYLSMRNSSGYRGVYWSNEKTQWVGLFKYRDIKRTRYFPATEQGKINAARFYDKWAIRIRGIFSRTNFPISDYSVEDVNDYEMNPRGRKASFSGYRGVYWDARDKKWRATAITERKQIYLGVFPNTEKGKIEAAHAYDRWVIQHRDITAYTNFPRADYD